MSLGPAGHAERRLLLVHRQDPLDPRTWSGTTANLADGLRDHGWSVVPVTAHRDVASTRMAERALRRIGVGPQPHRHPVLRSLAARVVDRALARHPADPVLHVGTLHLPMLRSSRRRPRWHGCYVDATWNLWISNATNADLYPSWLVRDAQRRERKAFHQMDHVFTTSRRTREDLVDVYGLEPSSVTVVGTGRGQALEDRPDWVRSPTPQVLFVAKHRLQDKGADVLLEAVELAQRRLPELGATFVGPSPEWFRRPLPPNVEVRPWVEVTELAKLYRTSWLFAMPARNEPWGLTYLEAHQTGTPTLGTARMAYPEIAGDGEYGIVVPEPRAELVAEALVRHLQDPVDLRRMGERARLAVMERFGWDDVVRRIIDAVPEPSTYAARGQRVRVRRQRHGGG